MKTPITAVQIQKLSGREAITSDGRKLRWFSGTDYLGMNSNENLRMLVQRGFEQYGVHYGSSRNSSVQLSIYDQAERHFAEFIGAPASLLVSSGMWAGQLVMREVENVVWARQPGLQVQYHYAPVSHPAIWGNAYQPTPLSWKFWTDKTISEINASPSDVAHIICADGTGSPMVQALDFGVFEKIENTDRTFLIIDESHALGALGISGAGIYKHIPEKLKSNAIILSSLNKAMGIPAGVISGGPEVLAVIRKSPFFSGASPAPPAYIFALDQMLMHGFYQEAHAQMLENLTFFLNNFPADRLFTAIPAYPVFTSPDAALFEYLLQADILTSCFAYPKPTDPPLSRMVVTAAHQQEDLSRLAEVCHEFLAKRSY